MAVRARPGRGTPGALAPRKSLGQHFLHDASILARIVSGAGVSAGERVLEIGPGLGGLTRALLGAGARVWAVEADRRMVDHLEGLDLPGLHVWQGNALETDFAALADEAGGALRLVANLPYNISGPLLAKLLRQRRAFASMTVMLQREVARRLVAPPGGRERGVLGVLAQSFCAVRLLFRVAPGAFRPPPKVDSSVVRLDVLPHPVVPLEDEEVLWEMVRTGFSQRRKMLRNALDGVAADLHPLLDAVGLTGRERPEALSVAQWAHLANEIARARRTAEG